MKIAIILGSKSDLNQCQAGLETLDHYPENTVNIFIRSQHRNTLDLQQLLRELVDMEYDVIIAGAGWANHLTGCVDAFLRYELKNTSIPVIGVAFADAKDQKHTEAAILSITEVPGTQVIFKNETGYEFVGRNGFNLACQYASAGKFPEITLPAAKPPEDMTLSEALKFIQESKK